MGGGGGGAHVARLNLKTSRVGVYRCLSLIFSFAVTVAIWPREVVSCRDFILRTVATFWAMWLVRIYPGRASVNTPVTSSMTMAEKLFKSCLEEIFKKAQLEMIFDFSFHF